MGMENSLKLKISRIFRSSAASCRPKQPSDTAEQLFFFPQNPHHHHHQLIELFSPNITTKPTPKPFPSICRPKPSKTQEITNTHFVPGRKIAGRSSILPFPAEKNAPALPPKQRKSRKSRRRKRNEKFDELLSSVSGSFSGWYSDSEEEENNVGKDYDDETIFFSSKSMSSDSSEYFAKNRGKKMEEDRVEMKKEREGQKGNFGFPMLSDSPEYVCKKMEGIKSEGNLGNGGQKGNFTMPVLEGKVKDSFAVVKRSSDPYNDFRTSMVEMIVERQIFGTKDLENLLDCFLSLNSVCHHKVIVEVYMEIWETLFSDCA